MTPSTASREPIRWFSQLVLHGKLSGRQTNNAMLSPSFRPIWRRQHLRFVGFKCQVPDGANPLTRSRDLNSGSARMHHPTAQKCTVLRYERGGRSFECRRRSVRLRHSRRHTFPCLCEEQPERSWCLQSHLALAWMQKTILLDAHRVSAME